MTREEILQIAKPMLFNTDMVQAILDDRKTATRRIAKYITQFDDKGLFFNIFRKGEWTGPIGREQAIEEYAPCKVGDILYVRETWGICNIDYDDRKVYVVYKAGDERKNNRSVILPEDKFQRLYDSYSGSEPDWRPSIHMPKEAARIFLRVTNVRVERLQDMWASDVSKEGIYFTKPHTADEMIAKFTELWNSTIPKKNLNKYGWEANPWVWVIEFEKVEVQ